MDYSSSVTKVKSSASNNTLLAYPVLYQSSTPQHRVDSCCKKWQKLTRFVQRCCWKCREICAV